MKALTADEQIKFNQLHIDCIAKDSRFRDWSELSPDTKAEIIDNAERLAEVQFKQRLV